MIAPYCRIKPLLGTMHGYNTPNGCLAGCQVRHRFWFEPRWWQRSNLAALSVILFNKVKTLGEFCSNLREFSIKKS